MKYYICSEEKYLDLKLSIVDKCDAYLWKSRVKAESVIQNLPESIRKYKFKVIPQTDYSTKDISSELNLDNFANSIEAFYLAYLSDSNRESLVSKLSELDLKVTDIEHAIEFNKSNVVEGYKYYKLLHDTLIERRKCKDALQKVQIISSVLNFNKASSLVSKLNGVETKTYNPRILTELFEEV